MRGGRLSSAERDRVIGQHAGYQFGRGLEFQRLGLASQMAEQRFKTAKARIAQADKERGLRKEGLKFSTRMAKDRLSQRRKDLRYTIGLGLGTAGLSIFEGRRRANLLEEERKRRASAEERQMKMLENQSALISKLGSTL
jgi:hypothetical protein